MSRAGEHATVTGTSSWTSTGTSSGTSTGPRARNAGWSGALTGAVACVLVGGALAGCTADGAEGAPTAPVPDSASTSSPEPTGEPTTTPVPLGPLDQLLRTVDGRSLESPEARLARLERSEEAVAACMAEQGFEYLPQDWRAVEAAQAGRESGDDARTALTPEAQIAAAAEYGYGVSTGSVVAAAQSSGPALTDPNTAQVDAMSSAEESAWYLALDGLGQGEAYLEGLEPYDWTQYGCSGRAAHEVEAAGLAVAQFDDSAWSSLREEIYLLEAVVPDDERLAGVRAGWAACMADAGHPGYADPSDAVMEIIDRSVQIWDQASAGVHLDMSTNDYLTDPAYLAQQAEVARLEAELAPIEIDLAVADATCQVEVDYVRAYTDTWLALQEEFYATHRADLDAWLAAFQEFEAAQG